MRNTTLGFFLAATAITAHAELFLPHGTDLPLPTGVQSDTLDAETLVTGSYLIPGYSESVALQYWKNKLSPSQYVFNTQTKTYTSHDKGVLVKTDSAGLVVSVVSDAKYDAGGVVHALTRRVYDGRGRQIGEYVYAGATKSVVIDSTRWVWSHPGCADEIRSDSRWKWSVDASGHCIEGSFLVPDPTTVSGWREDHRLKLAWDGRRLIGAFEVYLGDTLTREDYSYSPVDSLVLSIGTYCLSGSWYLAENTSFTYAAGGRLAKRMMQGFDSSGTMFARSTMASRQLSAGVRAPAESGVGSLRAWRMGGKAIFSNTTSEPVDVVVLAPDGSRRANLVVPPKANQEWSDRSTGGVLLWVAHGASFSGTGTLLPAQ